jgi:hypothetical protein
MRRQRSVSLAQSSNNLHKSVFAITLTALFQVVIVAKHPSVRYLVPSMGFLGLNIILVARLIVPMVTKRMYLAHGMIFLIVLSSTMATQLPKLRAVHKSLVDAKVGRLDVFREVQENYKGCKVISYFGASSLPSAWWLGDWGGARTFSRKLQLLYPDALFYQGLWDQNRRFFKFGQPVDFTEIASTNSCVVFQGNDPSSAGFHDHVYWPANVSLERVYSGSKEALYILKAF